MIPFNLSVVVAVRCTFDGTVTRVSSKIDTNNHCEPDDTKDNGSNAQIPRTDTVLPTFFFSTKLCNFLFILLNTYLHNGKY